MFTLGHFIWLAICAVFIVGLMLVAKKFKFDYQKALITVLVISFLSETCKIFSRIQNVYNEDGELVAGVLEASALPLHLCSIVIFLLIYLFVTKSDAGREAVKSFVALVAILGSIMAMLIPISGVGFKSIETYQAFLYHAGIMWFSIYLISTKQVDLGLKAYKRNLLTMAALVIVMIWLNSALQIYDTNFFFIVKPPMENLPILNLNNGWHVYFLTLVVIALTLVSLFHLPFIIAEIKQKKKELSEKEEITSAN